MKDLLDASTRRGRFVYAITWGAAATLGLRVGSSTPPLLALPLLGLVAETLLFWVGMAALFYFLLPHLPRRRRTTGKEDNNGRESTDVGAGSRMREVQLSHRLVVLSFAMQGGGVASWIMGRLAGVDIASTFGLVLGISGLILTSVMVLKSP